jgi:polyisoprenoid-binding protein YceI
VIGSLVAIVMAATLPAGSSLTVDPAASTVRYALVHKLHAVDGQSSQIEARTLVQPEGKVLVMVRLPVTSFRTGDANRDEHMLEVLEAGKYPFVVFKGVARIGADGALPAGPLEVRGEVEFHGVSRPVTVPVTIDEAPDGGLRVHGTFEVSLDAHHVERPSLLFVKVDDSCRIAFDLLLREPKR